MAPNTQALAERIETYMQQDPGSRGLARWACKAELLPAAMSLMESRHVLITTGFYVLSAGAIETDGPPGAITLAHALGKLGKTVTFLIDDHAAGILRAGLSALDCNAAVITVGSNGPIDPQRVLTPETTHFIALERPGRAEDGCYRNFKGMDISAFVAPVDDLFRHARRERKITTIGIGDGGNELGLKRVSAAVDQVVNGRPFSCRTGADYCICAGVSNWGGYAIAALLSHLCGQNLMPAPVGLGRMLEAIVAAGAVDGITGRPMATVDGLAVAWEQQVFDRMHTIAAGRDGHGL
jgi:hypothetical protein